MKTKFLLILALSLTSSLASFQAKADSNLFYGSGETAGFVKHLTGVAVHRTAQGTITVVLNSANPAAVLTCTSTACSIANDAGSVSYEDYFASEYLVTKITGPLATKIFNSMSGFTKNADGTFQFEYSSYTGEGNPDCSSDTIYSYNPSTAVFIINDEQTVTNGIACEGG